MEGFKFVVVIVSSYEYGEDLAAVTVVLLLLIWVQVLAAPWM